jgi:hypothetical protein
VHVLVLAGFVVFLVVPLILTLVGRRPGASDNRKPSPAPALRGDALLQTSTYQQLDRYLQDRFAFRALAIRISAKLNDKLWKGDTDQVRRGKGEWLYYQPSLTQLCTESMSPRQGTAVLEGLVSALQHNGKTVRYLLAPEKTSIYPENLTKRSVTDSQCALSAREQIRKGLGSHDWFLDIYDALFQLKASSPQPIYQPRDTHWTEQGAGVMLRTLVNSVQPGLWNDAEYENRGDQPFEPDLTRLLGLPQAISTPHYEVRRPGVVTTEQASDPVKGTFPVRHFTSVSSAGAPLIPGETVMIYDSFSIGSIPNLAPFFADITFVHWNAVGSSYDLPSRIKAAGTVLMEGAEREFTWRMRDRVAQTGLVEGIGR